MGTVEDEVVTLYLTRLSAFSQRVHLAILEKGITVKVVDVDLTDKPKELLEANPIWQKIPTIVHNGNSVAESTVILEYLEDVWPEQVPLLPKEAGERAKTRFWCDYVYKGILGILETLRTKAGSPERSAKLEAAGKFLKTLDETMAGFSAEGPYFLGDKFLLVDVVMAPLASLTTVLKEMGEIPFPRPEEAPRLHKWLKAARARPNFKVAIPNPDEQLKLFEEFIKKRAAAAAKATA